VSSGTQLVGNRLATFAPVGTYGMELVLKTDRRTLLAFGRRLTTCIQQQHGGRRDLCSSLVFDH